MTHSDGRSADTSWPPHEHALSVEFHEHPGGRRRPILIVSHPTAPYSEPLAENAPQDRLQEMASRYLQALHEHLERDGGDGLPLPDHWLDVLLPEKSPGPGAADVFGWLPPRRPGDEGPHGGTSPVLGRRETTDQTVILLAGEKLLDLGVGINRDFGLRVVMHLRKDDDGPFAVIVSMTAHLPYGRYKGLEAWLREQEGGGLPGFTPAFGEINEYALGATREIAAAASIRYGPEEDLAIDGFRFVQQDDGTGLRAFEVLGRGRGLHQPDDDPTSYKFAVELRLDADGATVQVAKLVYRVGLFADAASDTNPPTQARVFEQDPPSWRNPTGATGAISWHDRRPTREEDDLDGFRILRDIPEDLETADFRIRNCPRFVRTDPAGVEVKHVDLSQSPPRVREDDHSAVSAYWNCRQIFERMRGLGLEPADYFRHGALPIDVFYRSGISPGPGKDGRTVNARVKLLKPMEAGFPPETPYPIEVHLALANHSHRGRWPERPREVRWAEPLGVATSERWMLHEFGHVLIAAALGEHEFQFAHSMGDAMAAVWADPRSAVTAGDERAARFRGITMPFVFTPRRHDRCVLNGWSWCGRLQKAANDAPEIDRDVLKGYLSEQILSTTVFRLYRILGGDTVETGGTTPDLDRRYAASGVTLYLLWRAVESFGQLPARAEELAAAMIDSDVGLTAPLVPDVDAQHPHSWIGGRGHKAVRWAFEAQGMYAPAGNDRWNRPGLPPKTDIYLRDKRPLVEPTGAGPVQHGPGGYVPVSLDWSGNAGWFGSAPPTLGNRGSLPAAGIELRFWFGKRSGDPADPAWDRQDHIEWTAGSGMLSLDDVGSGADRELGELDGLTPDDPAADLLLVEVSCAGDRANSHPASGLATAVPNAASPPQQPREVADLVANDNNLALWTWPLV